MATSFPVLFSGTKLKELRLERGLSQHALALMSGVPQGRISLLETSKTLNPRTKTLAALACALSVKLDQLLT